MKEYEALIILPAKLDDEAVKNAIQSIDSEIVALGGEVIDNEVMGKKVFARPLNKQTVGIYVKLHFKSTADSIKKLLAKLKFNQDIFRIQVLKFDPVLAKARAEAKAAKEAKAAALVSAVEEAPVVTEDVQIKESEEEDG